MVDIIYRFMPTILPLKMEVNHEKQKFKNLAIFLLCSVFLTLFELFGSASANAAINRSISSESDKIASVDDDGNLRFKLSAQAASSGTRWKTVGLYVTSDPTE